MSVSRVHLHALTLVALLGAAEACTRGHDDDDDPSLLGIRGPISDYPLRDAAVTAPGVGAGSEDGSSGAGSNGGAPPPVVGESQDGGTGAPPFQGADAGAVSVGDAGTGTGFGTDADADAGDAGSDADADAGDASTDASVCWLLCP